MASHKCRNEVFISISRFRKVLKNEEENKQNKASPPAPPRRGRGVICFPLISTTVSHLHVYYHLYTDILHSMTHKIIALHMLNSIQI